MYSLRIIILSTFVKVVSVIFLLVICFFHVIFPRFAKHIRRERTSVDFSVIYTLIFQQGNERKKSQEGRDLENFTTTREPCLR